MTYAFARSLTLALTPLLLAACSTAAPRGEPVARTGQEPPLYVPSTMIAQAADAPPAINPYQLLPSSDADTLFVGRPEKFAYGGMVYAQQSSYSILTFDQQLISNLWGPSYRYRWIVQQGVTSP